MMMHGNEKLIVGGMICGWNDVRVVGDNLLLQDLGMVAKYCMVPMVYC